MARRRARAAHRSDRRCARRARRRRRARFAAPAWSESFRRRSRARPARGGHPRGGGARIIAPAGSGKTRVLTERARHLLTSSGTCRRARCASWRSTSGPRRRCASAPPTCPACRCRPSTPSPWRSSTACRRSRRSHRSAHDRRARRAAHHRRPRVVPPPPQHRPDRAVARGALGRPPRPASTRPRSRPVRRRRRRPRRRAGRRYRRALERRAPSTSTIRSTGRSRCCWPTRRPRRPAQRACRLLLVDEFQDLTPAHLLLIRLLAGPGGAVFGVGDDDQTIYGYYGADPAGSSTSPSCSPAPATTRSRSTTAARRAIVEVVDRLLRHNRRACRQDDPGCVERQHRMVGRQRSRCRCLVASCGP